ncbi:MAG: VanZ family protein [Proteobacteria bacterium]|nr:VanZ family protein [Pseudomonadota bacterium]
MTERETLKEPTARRLVNWLLVVIYASFIFILSSLSSPGASFLPTFYHSDKLIHFVEFFIFGFLLYRALNEYQEPKKAFMTSFFIVSLYGFTDELHQYIVPLRSAEALDLLADSLGGLLGTSFAMAGLRGGSLE